MGKLGKWYVLLIEDSYSPDVLDIYGPYDAEDDSEKEAREMSMNVAGSRATYYKCTDSTPWNPAVVEGQLEYPPGYYPDRPAGWSMPLEQIKKWLWLQMKQDVKIERFIEILFGDIYEQPPNTFSEFLEKNGIPRDKFHQMSSEEKTETLKQIWESGS